MNSNITKYLDLVNFEIDISAHAEFVSSADCAELVLILRAGIVNEERGFDHLEYENFLFLAERDRNKIINYFGKKSLYTMLSLIKQLMKIYEIRGDIRFLNTILKVLEKLMRCSWVRFSKKTRIKLIHNIVEQIAYEEVERNICNFEPENRDYFPKLDYLGTPIIEGVSNSVVVFSPNRYSSLTLAVLALLKKNKFHIDLVIIRRIAKISRVRLELKRDRDRFIKKVFRKLLMSERVRGADGGRNLSDTRRELDITDKSVVKWCDRHGVKYLFCNELSDNGVVDVLSQNRPSYGLFTGGGILSDKLLSCFSKGILNPHFGILPQYRGMDVIEWPFLFHDKKNIGITVHFMTAGIDEGEILLSYKGRDGTDIKSLRYEFESYSPYLLVEALAKHLATNSALKQKFEDGLRYYVLSPSLYRKAYTISRTTSPIKKEN